MKHEEVHMKQWKTVALITIAALWASPSAAFLATCKAKINAKDGVILVDAQGVTGTLLWGQEAGKEIFPLFDNTGTCINPDPKKCQLGALDTPERLYPPEGCVVYLKDTGDMSTCSAYIKKCVPGRRPCPSDMVSVGGFCIDKYEASVWDSATGTTQYGVAVDDYPCTDNGQNCTNIYARSVAGVVPSIRITWSQAQQACHNVGKRLPTNAEWQQAVTGTPDPGPDNGITDCNTASAGAAVNTGSRSSCVSAAGAFDMVGNLHEWVADWVPQSTGCPNWGPFSNDLMCLSGASTTATAPGALLRGGGWNSFTAAGPFYVDGSSGGPKYQDNRTGFRCAR